MENERDGERGCRRRWGYIEKSRHPRVWACLSKHDPSSSSSSSSSPYFACYSSSLVVFLFNSRFSHPFVGAWLPAGVIAPYQGRQLMQRPPAQHTAVRYALPSRTLYPSISCRPHRWKLRACNRTRIHAATKNQRRTTTTKKDERVTALACVCCYFINYFYV